MGTETDASLGRWGSTRVVRGLSWGQMSKNGPSFERLPRTRWKGTWKVTPGRGPHLAYDVDEKRAESYGLAVMVREGEQQGPKCWPEEMSLEKGFECWPEELSPMEG